MCDNKLDIYQCRIQMYTSNGIHWGNQTLQAVIGIGAVSLGSDRPCMSNPLLAAPVSPHTLNFILQYYKLGLSNRYCFVIQALVTLASDIQHVPIVVQRMTTIQEYQWRITIAQSFLLSIAVIFCYHKVFKNISFQHCLTRKVKINNQQ